jgi:hypothetical protein
MNLIEEKGFKFLNAEIGVDETHYFIESIKPVDFVYSAPPFPSVYNINYWRWDNGQESADYSYSDFFDSFSLIMKQLEATEFHIETEGEEDRIIDLFMDKLGYSHHYQNKIMYSAPTTKNGTGLAKRRIKTSILSFSMRELDLDFDYEYSHEFLEKLLSARNEIVCFDPCIGKGLLSRVAIENGHTCHGIEMNQNRLNCAVEYVRGHK